MSYDTIKIVRIKDVKLGILHYFLMAAIVGYILGYTVIYEKRYVVIGNPVGTVRLSLLAPAKRTASSDLPYCWPSKDPHIPANMTFNCTYFDEMVALPSVASDASIFVSTRITSNLEKLHNCTVFDKDCTYILIENSTIYITDIENFTIMVDHSMYVYTTQFNMQTSATSLTGELYDSNNQKVTHFLPGEQFGVSGKFDILQLGTVLSLSGINSLDSPGASRAFLTKRYEGLLIFFFIQYTNMLTYNLNDIRYIARATFVRNSYSKIEESVYPFPTNTSKIDYSEYNSRIVRDRHGVRVVFVQTGTIGKLDIPTALISFASGLGLIAISTFIVDTIATKIMPKKKVYEHFKISEAAETEMRRKESERNINVVYPEGPLQTSVDEKTPILQEPFERRI
uniref:Purinergic receptor n=1 Tax=Arcella intermedia TaxID=1963864 RepID=A0A6B2L636_9EUKA